MSVPEAGERTGMAWQRSGVSMMACGFAMVRGVHGIAPSRPLAGTLVLVLGLSVWGMFLVVAYRRGRGGSFADPRPARVSDTAPLALGTALVGAGCVLLVLVGG